MRDPIWYNPGSWNEERPTAISQSGLGSALDHGLPHRDLGSFFSGIVQSTAEQIVLEDPVEEFERRLTVAKYRGRHVLASLVSHTVIQASLLEPEDFRRLYLVADAHLCLDDAMARLLLDRLNLLSGALFAIEHGSLDPQIFKTCGRLLDPYGVALHDLPQLSDEIHDALSQIIDALPTLREYSPHLAEAIEPQLLPFMPESRA
ncbi:MAG: hypothetical protein EA397_19845 [Deltaproteobacteria bacterium]|nr:MAG: hypothetical protein EA397_19845 [Deltaproteobacteria bacterium]